jgi:hypothetical protein
MSKSQNVKMSKLKKAKNNLYLSLDGFDTDLKFHFNLKNNSKKDLKAFVK